MSEELERLAAEVGFTVSILSADMTFGDEVRLRRDVRVLMPRAENWAGLLVRAAVSRRESPGELELAARLLAHHSLTSLWRRRNTRRLDPTKLLKNADFAEAARTARHVGPPQDLIPHLVGPVSDAMEDLLKRARYTKPLRRVPVDRATYEEFREMLLAELEETASNARRIVKDFGVPAEHEDEAVDLVLKSHLRRIATQARDRDRKEGPQLEPLANRADALAEEAERRAIAHPRTPFRRIWDWPTVTQLIRDAVSALRATAQFGDVKSDHVDQLEAIAAGNNIHAKAEAVRWIWKNCRDRSPLLEHFLLDVECAGSFVLDHFAKRLYGRIRRHLDPCERRIFAFMYMQSAPMFGAPGRRFRFDGVTLMFDPVLLGALLDPTITSLVIFVIGEKRRVVGETDLSVELDRRFRAYLRFYPYWLETQRDRDRRERKARRVHSRLGRKVHGDIERVVDPNSPARGGRLDLVAQLLRASEHGSALELFRQFGVADADGILDMALNRRMSQAEIASAKGITQQAVSAKIRRRWNLLLQRLRDEGITAVDERLPKNKWAPRG